MDRHEILIDDGLDFGGLDETIEFLTPPSPGRAKDDEDGALTGRGPRLGLVEEGISGRPDLRVRQRNAEQKGGDCAAKTRPVALHASSIPPRKLSKARIVYGCLT
jgi:hypothetical protein